MKRKRYTEPQIVFAVQQAEGGTPVVEISRAPGVPTLPAQRRREACWKSG
jgi:hypothetical protein